jgi:TolB protein
MKRKSVFFALVFLTVATAAALLGQDITAWINKFGGKPALAVIDFRGTGAEPYMAAFNSTLFNDLQGSALFDMTAKSLFPLNNPQRPEDLRSGGNSQGFSLSDWGGAPVNASHLVFGYTAVQNGALVLYGYVDDTRQANPQSAQLMAQRYVGSLDEAGATRVAHEFANDIIQKFGGTGSLLGSRIYYVSKRGGNDGSGRQ